MAEQKRQIRMLQVALTPAQHRSVEGYHQSAVAALLRALQQTRSELMIFAPIELKPMRRGRHCLADFLHRARRNSTQGKRNAQRPSSARNCEFGFRMNDVLHANGPEKNGRGKIVAEEFDGEIALGYVAQHARHDAPAIEGLEIGSGGALP